MKAYFLLFVFSFGFSILAAQTLEKFHYGLQATVGFPVGEFAGTVHNSLGGTGWGLGMNFILNPKKAGFYSPVMIGIEGNYLHLGRDKTPETTFHPPLKTNFNYFNIGPIIRVFLNDREEGFVPFIDGFVGMKVLNTRTQVDNKLLDTILGQENLESLLSNNYEGLGYGLGLGFYKRKVIPNHEPGQAAFYMRLIYQYGDRINYIKRGSIKVDSEGFFIYQTGRTQTSIFTLNFGVLIK